MDWIALHDKELMKISLLSACVALFATAITWRGIWVLADAYLYPNDPALSALWSLILGLFSFLMLKLVVKYR